MIYSKFFPLILMGSSAIALLELSPVLSSPVGIPTAIAQSSGLEFSDVGRPRRRQGGGSRGSCLIADRPPLTALVPDSSTGFTLAQSPSFWFYLPYSLTDRHSIEFVLKDSQDNLVYSQTISGQDAAPGMFNLRLPESIALDTNQSYEWYLLVQCDAENQERFVFVNGAIRRLERPDLQQQITTLNPIDRTSFYTRENLWYDAIDSAASQLQSTPQRNGVYESWMTLLESIGLTELASESIAP